MQPDFGEIEPLPAPLPTPLPPEDTPHQIQSAPIPDERQPFWGYSDLALVIGLLFASIVLLLLLIGGLNAVYPKIQTNPTALVLPMQLALYGLIYLDFRLIFGARYGRPVFASLGWRRTGFNVFLTVIGGIALAFALSAIASLIHTPKVDSPIEQLAKDPVNFVAFAIIAVSIAPLFEELFFRGFLQPLFSRSVGMVAGIVLTAALFGALHAPEYSWAWQYGVAVGLAGAIFGWIRAKTNSIIPSTIMHGSYNAVFVVALAFSKHSLNR